MKWSSVETTLALVWSLHEAPKQQSGIPCSLLSSAWVWPLHKANYQIGWLIAGEQLCNRFGQVMVLTRIMISTKQMHKGFSPHCEKKGKCMLHRMDFRLCCCLPKNSFKQVKVVFTYMHVACDGFLKNTCTLASIVISMTFSSCKELQQYSTSLAEMRVMLRTRVIQRH